MMLSLGEHKRANGIYVLTRTRLLDVYVWRFLFEPEQIRLDKIALSCSHSPGAHQLSVYSSKRKKKGKKKKKKGKKRGTCAACWSN